MAFWRRHEAATHQEELVEQIEKPLAMQLL